MNDIVFPETQRTDEELIANFERWLAAAEQQREPRLLEVARKLSPLVCYRQCGRPQTHYALQGYEVPKDLNKPITVTMTHGADSTLPSVSVFGMDPEDLEVCACGKWRRATDEQLAAMDTHFKALHLARSLCPKDDDQRQPPWQRVPRPHDEAGEDTEPTDPE